MYGIYIYTPNGPAADPTAVISCDDNIRRIGEEFYFQGSGFSGEYFWDYGDGDIECGPVFDTYHSYDAQGIYRVTVRERDSNGRTDEATIYVQVLQAHPIAVGSADPEENGLNGDITFSGSESSDDDGTIEEYYWYFDDGAFATGETVTHSFGEDGIHEAILTVMDNDGEIGTNVVDFTITQDYAPITEAGSDQITFVHRNTPFSGAGTTDPDGEINLCAFSWDFGDDSEPAIGSTQSHEYDSIGTYIVTLTVTDEDGYTDMDTIIVEVKSANWSWISARFSYYESTLSSRIDLQAPVAARTSVSISEN